VKSLSVFSQGNEKLSFEETDLNFETREDKKAEAKALRFTGFGKRTG
jgi:hypothetical protein